ncbi:hypothetical protein TNCV_21461 [Trichonephila clavipes]|nr:hypothetical protein TNCV_21461 [Trichonephila clavipes]
MRLAGLLRFSEEALGEGGLGTPGLEGLGHIKFVSDQISPICMLWKFRELKAKSEVSFYRCENNEIGIRESYANNLNEQDCSFFRSDEDLLQQTRHFVPRSSDEDDTRSVATPFPNYQITPTGGTMSLDGFDVHLYGWSGVAQGLELMTR